MALSCKIIDTYLVQSAAALENCSQIDPYAISRNICLHLSKLETVCIAMPVSVRDLGMNDPMPHSHSPTIPGARDWPEVIHTQLLCALHDSNVPKFQPCWGAGSIFNLNCTNDQCATLSSVNLDIHGRAAEWG